MTKKKLFSALFIIVTFISRAQNSPFEIWGNGLDGSTLQRTSIYSQLPNGLIIEAPKDANDNKLPIQFSWRGGGMPPFYINGDGNIGIGSVSPQTKLDVNGIIQTYNKDTNIATWDNLRIWSEGENSIIEANGDEKGLIIRSNTGNKILLMNNVGIGISNPTNKLDVNGTIHSKEVKVDMNGWSDFVFKKEYDLPTLEEVEKHIKEKGHLANIPNEQEVLKSGINLGKMDAKLLQKVEELTLYVIEQNKEINTLKEEKQKTEILALKLEKMQSEINSLKKKLK